MANIKFLFFTESNWSKVNLLTRRAALGHYWSTWSVLQSEEVEVDTVD